MLGSLPTLWRLRRRLLAGLAAPALLALSSADAAPAELPALAPALTTHAVTSPTTLGLAACRQLALQQQPALAVARASLSAAILRQQALDNLRVPTLLARDLPTRRQQAALGVVIAQASLQQAELNTLYGVNYSYLSCLYAKQQLKVADTGLANLRQLRDVINQAITEEKRRDLSGRDRDKLDIYLLIARGRREEAAQGVERAISALREALGVGPDHVILIANDRLLDVKSAPDKQQILALAVSRRPEMIQAIHGAEVTGLEVCAQEKKHFHPSVPTFAAGGDLHAQPLPAGSFNGNYKPAAVGPEMPVTLNGSRADRVEQARAYSSRAEALVAKTRGLLTLEAEQAYLRWEEASKKLAQYEKAAEKASALFAELQPQFVPDTPKMPLEPLLNAAVLNAQLTAQVNELRYRQLLALAELERVSAGCFSAGLDTAPQLKEDTNGKGNGAH